MGDEHLQRIPEPERKLRYCSLTTQGRVTGRRHTAELWFVPAEGGAYLMSDSGGLTQWCLNLQAEEQGVLRLGEWAWLARASFLPEDSEERAEALEAFHRKYEAPGTSRLDRWLRKATVVHLVLVRQLE